MDYVRLISEGSFTVENYSGALGMVGKGKPYSEKRFLIELEKGMARLYEQLLPWRGEDKIISEIAGRMESYLKIDDEENTIELSENRIPGIEEMRWILCADDEYLKKNKKSSV